MSVRRAQRNAIGAAGSGIFDQLWVMLDEVAPDDAVTGSSRQTSLGIQAAQVPLRSHPGIGVIVMCNFEGGFREPEMVKRRPVVIVSPKIAKRPGLCTVVPLSTSAPNPVMPYHCKIRIDAPLPDHWQPSDVWVKGDMVCSVGFHRIDLIRIGRDASGKRVYRMQPVSDVDLRRIRECVLASLGLATLKKHVP